jgi:hypothetical protein
MEILAWDDDDENDDGVDALFLSLAASGILE